MRVFLWVALMISISVKSDVKKLQTGLIRFRSNVLDRATSSAINKTTTTVRAAAVKAIRQKLKTIKAAVIRRRLFLKRSTVQTLTAIISNRAQNTPRQSFLIPGSDMERVRFGKKHRTIISKSGKSQGKKISSGFQIRRLTNLEISKTLASNEVKQVMLQTVRQRFPILLEREFKYYADREKNL
jgi:hypothetical protein